MKEEDDEGFLAPFFCEEVSDDFLLMLKVFLLGFMFVGGIFSCE